MTVIIGIDPGTRCSGWAVLDLDGQLIASGEWQFDVKESLDERLKHLYFKCLDLLTDYCPACLAVEIPPGKVSHRPQRADVPLILGQAVGIIKGAAVNLGIEIIDIYPSSAKAAIGSGRFTKVQVQQAIQERFELDELPGPDEGMAIAIALAGLKKFNEQKAQTTDQA